MSLKVAAMVMAISCVGCQNQNVQTGKPPLINGNMAILPSSSTVGMHRLTLGVNNSYCKFEGCYPDHWPESLQLPGDCYIYESNSVTLINHEEYEDSECYVYSNQYLVEMSTTEIASYFKEQFAQENINLIVRKSSHTPYPVKALKAFQHPAYDNPPSVYATIILIIPEYNDIGGWHIFDFTITVLEMY